MQLKLTCRRDATHISHTAALPSNIVAGPGRENPQVCLDGSSKVAPFLGAALHRDHICAGAGGCGVRRRCHIFLSKKKFKFEGEDFVVNIGLFPSWFYRVVHPAAMTMSASILSATLQAFSDSCSPAFGVIDIVTWRVIGAVSLVGFVGTVKSVKHRLREDPWFWAALCHGLRSC